MKPEESQRKCPKCGTTGTGKFCHGCGLAIGSGVCAKCSVSLSPGAQFCHACGTPTANRPSAGGSAKLPWAVAGAAVVISILVLVARGAPSPPAMSVSGAMSRPNVGAPDISNMSPVEQADGLFEVVMIALERGDTAQVGFHAPMALSAYRNLDSLDADAQYHVGLLRGALGDHDGMAAMADTLQAVVPGHLLATTLRKAVAEARGDTAGVHAAYRQFLADYENEARVVRREYQLHQRSIDAFLEEARRATGGEHN